MNATLRPRHARQHGAATLVVVMVLFLVMALLAAYANRSMLFEQRIASGYSRASLSQEVAEAGVEWTLAQLNGTATNASCTPVNSGGQRFADRYLTINSADRTITPAASDQQKWIADCARDLANNGWACRCPDPALDHVTSTATGGTNFTPSFGIRMFQGARGGTVVLKVLGCTDSVFENCYGEKAAAVSNNQLARIMLSTQLGFVSAVRSPPASPLLVGGNVQSTGAGLGLHNGDTRSAGMLATLGGTWTGRMDSRLESVPGTAIGQLVLENDPTLAAAGTGDAVFKMFMGTSVTRYPTHPALRTVPCTGDCTAALDSAYQAGKRILWVNGNLTISSNATLGSLANPVLIIANGNITLSGPLQINGMLVAKGSLSWSGTGAMPSLVNGIVLVGGNMSTDGAVDIVYQQTVADQLRNRVGSFVRIPGGWIDRDS
jgi:hypothetical protein